MLQLSITATTATIDDATIQKMVASQKEIELKKLELVEKVITGLTAMVQAVQEARKEEARTSQVQAEEARFGAETQLLQARVRLLEVEARIEEARAETAKRMVWASVGPAVQAV